MANKLGWPPVRRYDDQLNQLGMKTVELKTAQEPVKLTPFNEDSAMVNWHVYYDPAMTAPKNEERQHLRISQLYSRIKRLEKRVKELEGRK